MGKVWNVGIYARVSTDKKQQQESIFEQIRSLTNWIQDKIKEDKNNTYNLVDIYEDHGFSGSNFERESFKKMKRDIEIKKVNMVLTRDLSRFARNYIIAGYYIEDYFKDKGIRFVSVLDNVDTLEEINDIVPFKNILNEMYIKDCSKRTRDGLKQRMMRGSSIASRPPYGYKFEKCYKDNIKVIRLVPKEDETTKTVRDIFRLYLSGWGMEKIATYLNNKGIYPPSFYSKFNNKRNNSRLWTSNTIRYIITNPKYGGIMVQGRWKKVSYKLKKIKAVPKEEWIVGGEFKGIISKKTFYKVQSIIKKRAKNYRYKKNKIHIFSGVLKCNECGEGMYYRGRYKGYKCKNSQRGGGICTSHSVKEEYLIETIKDNLKEYLNENINKDKVYKTIFKKYKYPYNYKNELINIEKELKKIDNQFEEIYIDKLNGIINEENFQNISRRIKKRQHFLIIKKRRIDKLKSKNNNIESSYYKEIKDKIDNIFDFKVIDRTIVEAFIDRIVVTENKDAREKRIDIYYNFKK